jgi:hypothetical protein
MRHCWTCRDCCSFLGTLVLYTLLLFWGTAEAQCDCPQQKFVPVIGQEQNLQNTTVYVPQYSPGDYGTYWYRAIPGAEPVAPNPILRYRYCDRGLSASVRFNSCRWPNGLNSDVVDLTLANESTCTDFITKELPHQENIRAFVSSVVKKSAYNNSPACDGACPYAGPDYPALDAAYAYTDISDGTVCFRFARSVNCSYSYCDGLRRCPVTSENSVTECMELLSYNETFYTIPLQIYEDGTIKFYVELSVSADPANEMETSSGLTSFSFVWILGVAVVFVIVYMIG